LKTRLPAGVLGLTYLGLYAVGRFFLSNFRTDPAVFAGMRQAQLASLVMAAIAVVAIPILFQRYRAARPVASPEPVVEEAAPSEPEPSEPEAVEPPEVEPAAIEPEEATPEPAVPVPVEAEATQPEPALPALPERRRRKRTPRLKPPIPPPDATSD
jgi:hypothetical protein